MLGSLVLVGLLAGPVERPVGKVGQCDPDGGPRFQWTREQRREVRDRVHDACRAQGAALIVCAWLDVSGLRESSWSPSVRHRRGEREDGIGVLGLDKHAQRRRWPEDPEPAWCQPEASVVVALSIARSAIRKWGARDVSDIQAVFAFRTFRDEDGQLHVRKDYRANERLCKGMMARGFSCRRPVTLKDLGPRTPVEDRPARARELAALFDAG